MRIIRVKDYQALSQVAGQMMVDLLKQKPNAVLGLATGSSPIGLYQYLIESFKKQEISFKQVRTYNLDEYCGLPRTHPESYYNFMHRNLFYHVDIKEENVHVPSAEGSDLQAQCDAYNDLLHHVQVDVQLLGIGGNGHIGFNEPGTSFDTETFVVKLTEKTRQDNKRFFNSIDEVPTHAITMGIKNIMQAKELLLIASGKSKADAIYQLVHGPVHEGFPASILQRHPNVTIVVDEEAASLL